MGMVAVVTRHTVPPQDTQAGAGPHWLSRVLFFRLGRDLPLNPRFYQSRKAGTDQVHPPAPPCSACLKHRGSRGICQMKGGFQFQCSGAKNEPERSWRARSGSAEKRKPLLLRLDGRLPGRGWVRPAVPPLTCVMAGLLSWVWQHDFWPRW